MSDLITFKVRRPKGRPRNRERITAFMIARTNALWRDSISAFVQAAMGEIHIDSGMSVSSLAQLASMVRARSTLVAAITGKGEPRRHTPDDVEVSYYNAIGLTAPKVRTKTLGRDYGEKSPVIKFATERSPKLAFVFRIRVYQWSMNEGKMWNAFGAGERALTDFFNSNKRRYLDSDKLARYILTGPPPAPTEGSNG